MGSTLWLMLTIIAGIAFIVAIGWAMTHNRGTPEEAATEEATRRMYDEQARDDGMIR